MVSILISACLFPFNCLSSVVRFLLFFRFFVIFRYFVIFRFISLFFVIYRYFSLFFGVFFVILFFG